MSELDNKLSDKILVANIKRWGAELGFQQVGISDVNLSRAETLLDAWLEKGFHGKMHY